MPPPLPQHVHPFLPVPLLLNFLFILFGSRLCSYLFYSHILLPSVHERQQALSCFAIRRSLCGILNTRAGGEVEAWLGRGSGSRRAAGSLGAGRNGLGGIISSFSTVL